MSVLNHGTYHSLDGRRCITNHQESRAPVRQEGRVTKYQTQNIHHHNVVSHCRSMRLLKLHLRQCVYSVLVEAHSWPLNAQVTAAAKDKRPLRLDGFKGVGLLALDLFAQGYHFKILCGCLM